MCPQRPPCHLLTLGPASLGRGEVLPMLKMSLLMSGGWTRGPLKVPSKPNYSVILSQRHSFVGLEQALESPPEKV